MGWSVVFDGFLVCLAENIHVALNRRYHECISLQKHRLWAEISALSLKHVIPCILCCARWNLKLSHGQRQQIFLCRNESKFAMLPSCG